MDAPDRFEMTGHRAFYRPVGTVSLRDVVDMVSLAIAHACAKGASEMLVNLSAVAGFAPPTTIERYRFVTKWVATAGGRLQLAVVVRPKMIDRHKFGVTVATNRGLMADVFTTEAEALAWLDGTDGSQSLRGPNPAGP